MSAIGVSGWFLIALLGGALGRANAMPPVLPVIPPRNFDVTVYGAVADGVTDNAVSIQTAIKAAVDAGGGTVRLPAASKSYLCGPITLSSFIRLQVDQGATLAILGYAQYPLVGTGYATWLTSKGATNLEISGRGTIDGQGQAWWDAFNADNNMPHRPYMINLQDGQRVRVHQITLKNSPSFHLALTNDNDVMIDSITILAPGNSPNTDGMDPSGQNYLIRDDSVSVGDDNIAIKPGAAYCKNFFISNCRFGTGHGVSVGGQSRDGLDSLSVTDCRFTGGDNGIRLKANRTNGGACRHMQFTNLTMNNVRYPIYFTSYYGNSSPDIADPDSVITPLTPIWRDVVVANVVSKSTASNATAGFFWGLPEMPLDSITLANVDITAPKPMVVNHAAHFRILNSSLSPTSISASDATPQVSSPAFEIIAAPWPVVDSTGHDARFEVVATGTSTIGYQWYADSKALNDGGNVSGAKSSVLVLKNLTRGDAGAYTVKMSNTSGSATAGPASLTVLEPSTTLVGSLRKIRKSPSARSTNLLGRRTHRHLKIPQ